MIYRPMAPDDTGIHLAILLSVKNNLGKAQALGSKRLGRSSRRGEVLIGMSVPHGLALSMWRGLSSCVPIFYLPYIASGEVRA